MRPFKGHKIWNRFTLWPQIVSLRHPTVGEIQLSGPIDYFGVGSSGEKRKQFSAWFYFVPNVEPPMDGDATVLPGTS